jgi:hypothetical protein
MREAGSRLARRRRCADLWLAASLSFPLLAFPSRTTSASHRTSEASHRPVPPSHAPPKWSSRSSTAAELRPLHHPQPAQEHSSAGTKALQTHSNVCCNLAFLARCSCCSTPHVLLLLLLLAAALLQMSAAPHSIQANPVTGVDRCITCGAKEGTDKYEAGCTKPAAAAGQPNSALPQPPAAYRSVAARLCFRSSGSPCSYCAAAPIQPPLLPEQVRVPCDSIDVRCVRALPCCFLKSHRCSAQWMV